MKRQLAIIGILTLLFTLLNFGFTYITHAESKDRLEIKVEAGLNGKAKQQQGFPVNLTITNNKEDFTGDLVITLPREYQSVGNKVIPIDIAAGTKKTISFSVSGMEGMDLLRQGFNQNVQQFHLYEGNWQTGKEVTIDSSLELNPNYVQEDKLVIGVLSDRPDSLNYLKLATFLGNSPEVLMLQEKDLPEDVNGLDVLDLLVVNDYAIATLPKQIQETIKNWVQKGGTLITGSEPGLQQQFGEIANMLPVKITGKESVQNIEGFNTIYQEPLKGNNLELFTGNIDEDATISFKENTIPLLVKKEFGKGVVAQFAYDLGHPAVSGWNGNNLLWQKIATDDSNINLKISRYDYRMEDVLTNSSRIFPTLANFKISELLLLFIVYLLLLVPILYFILKKLDKREWAWIIIPIIAIVSSVGLYTVGAKERLGDIKTNSVSAITVDKDGIGSGFGATSMLSKESGSYTLTMDRKLAPFPSGGQYSNQQSNSSIPFIEEDGEKTNVQFQDVEFWSPRSVAIEYPLGDYGSFAADLALENEQITGDITNNFSYDLKDIYLISGQNYHEIGKLVAGDSKKITIDAKNKDFFQQPTIRSQMDKNDDNPILIGFANKPLYDVNVNGDETVQNDQHLFSQAVTIRLPEGERVSLSSEINMPDISIIQGQIYFNGIGQGERFFDAEAGSYQLTYAIGESFREKSFRLEELGIDIQERMQGISYLIYNVQTDTYESIGQNQASYKQNAHENYVKDNKIVIRVDSSTEGMITVPAVSIKGVTNP